MRIGRAAHIVVLVSIVAMSTPGVRDARAADGGTLASVAAQATCFFTLGFKALRDQIPDTVGDCLENEHFNLENGSTALVDIGGGSLEVILTAGTVISYGEESLPETHALRNTGDDEILIVTTELL